MFCDKYKILQFVYMNLHVTMLIGIIPTQVGALQNLTHLDLSNNNLVGVLPSTLTTITTGKHTFNYK